MIQVAEFMLPPYNRTEICRYAGVRQCSPEMEKALDRCLETVQTAFAGRVCWTHMSVSVTENQVEFPFARIASRALAQNLRGCREVILFAATVGMTIDRLIRRYSVGDMASAVWLQAIGTERVEALCRVFCDKMAAEAAGRFLRPRFSPGYGDLPITMQRDLIALLDTPRKIGVSLSDGCLMTPSKSVTAVVGIGPERCSAKTGGCGYCDRTDCPYREEPE